MSQSAAVADITGDYSLDTAHSRLGFVARHAVVTKVRGQFGAFEGTASIDTATPANSQVDLSIDVASIDTGNEDRNAHVTSGVFFDVETYPSIRFVSTHVERDGDTWAITGDLTIKDATRSVTIDFEQARSAVDPSGNTRVGFKGETTVNRKDFGLVWNAALEAGGLLVSDKVKLEFDISAIKSA